jgi:nucleoside-diphosphate-sugar epimerase
MAILVTGAAGFVGLNVVEHLLLGGTDVVGFDRLALPPRAAAAFAAYPGRLTMIEGSVLSPGDLGRAMAHAPIEAAIHCAVITAGSAREKADPESIVAVNVQGAVATLAAAARHGIERFVYPSSVSVYGTAAIGVDPVPESLPPAPVMIYGMTKLACEILLPRVAQVQGVRLAIARLASVFGPWEYETGVRDTLSPMKSALELARAGKEAVLSQPGLGDFCYSRDIAAGLVGLAMAPALNQVIYNLGSGLALSAEDWCRAVAAIVPGFQWRRAAEGEAANTISHVAFDRGGLDITAIARDTGYRPAFPMEKSADDYCHWLAGEDHTTPVTRST